MSATKIPDTTVTVRLPSDLVEFVDRLAEQQFNNRSGILRMAVATLRNASAAAEENKDLPCPKPPMAMAG